MQLCASQDIMVAGSDIVANDTVSLKATNDIALLTQEDIWVEMSSKGSLGGSKYHERAEQNPATIASIEAAFDRLRNLNNK